MLKRECCAESNGKLSHPSKSATLVPQFTVEDLSLGSYRTLVKLELWFRSLRWKTCLWVELQSWVPKFTVKDLLLGRTLMIFIYRVKTIETAKKIS